MQLSTANNFLELEQVWENKKNLDIESCYKTQVDNISFKPKLKNRIDSVQILAISVMTINVVIPCTAFPVTNPLIYKSITSKLNSHEIDRFWNNLKMRFL